MMPDVDFHALYSLKTNVKGKAKSPPLSGFYAIDDLVTLRSPAAYLVLIGHFLPYLFAAHGLLLGRISLLLPALGHGRRLWTPNLDKPKQ